VSSSIIEESIGITQAKSTLPDVVRRLVSGDLARAVLFRRNRPVAVLLPVDVYERLENLAADLEHVSDALALAQAERINDGHTISLDELDEKFGV
jgi:prevent-host-death family protein